jgi:poly(hydroxyalkanoate) depolymerase family esterase
MSRLCSLTSRLLRFAIAASVAVGLSLHVAPLADAASLTQITKFGANPTGLAMYLYVPNNVKANPPILLALHGCQGSGPYLYSSTDFGSLADEYGFVVIYPSTNPGGSCWDVSSKQALTRNGGSDPVGLMSMITYTEQRYGGNPGAVYVTGESSGGMMTNVMLADYPDVFQAGVAFMGVPYHCFATGTVRGWNGPCAGGQVSMTPQQWGDLARNADPGYTGPRPRVQVWHGTADTILNYHNLGEEIKQWTNVLGVSQIPSSTDNPVTNWTHTRYANNAGTAEVEAFSIAGAGHQLPIQGSGMAAYAIHFMGLGGGSAGGSGGTVPPKQPSTTAPPTSPAKTPASSTTSVRATLSNPTPGKAEPTIPSATANRGCHADAPTPSRSTDAVGGSSLTGAIGCASPSSTDSPNTYASTLPTSIAQTNAAEPRSPRSPSPWWWSLLLPLVPAALWFGRYGRRRAPTPHR